MVRVKKENHRVAEHAEVSNKNDCRCELMCMAAQVPAYSLHFHHPWRSVHECRNVKDIKEWRVARFMSGSQLVFFYPTHLFD